MFIRDDEHILLMETDHRRFTIDELKSFVGVGIGTMLSLQYWFLLEPEMGIYDWSKMDDVVDRSQKAGLKLLVQIPSAATHCLPVSWYAKCKDGEVLNSKPDWPKAWVGKHCPMLSYWNKEAMAYREAFIEMACKRYNSDTVMATSSFLLEGESFLPEKLFPVYDDAALAAYRQHMGDPNKMPVTFSRHSDFKDMLGWLNKTFMEFALRNQKIYAVNSTHRELWQQLHWAYDRYPHTGTPLLEKLYFKTKEDTGCDVHQVFFTGYDWSLDKPIGFKSRGMNVWLGACWTEGLLKNTPNAIENGFRGLICAPIHHFLPYERVEPWMISAFDCACKQWAKVRKDG